jgi:hypothetical protein
MTLIAFVRAEPYSVLIADTAVTHDDNINTENKIEQIGDVILSSSTYNLGKERHFVDEIAPSLEKIASIDELLSFLRSNRFKGHKDAADMILCHRKSNEGVRYSPSPKVCQPISIFDSCGNGSKVADSYLQTLNRSMKWRKYAPSTDIARRALLETAYKTSSSLTTVNGPFDIVYLPQKSRKIKIETINSIDDEWRETVIRLEKGDKERYKDLLKMARKDL